MKLENMNIVKSFKIRGALNAILNLDKKKVKGVITASAGNHAQGVAYSATKAGIKSIIVMPKSAPMAKINATKGFGGTVVADKCDTFDECNEYAQQQAKALNYTFVPPFDSEDVIAGQATIGLEMMQQVPNLDMVIVQIGGGGLIAGVASAIKQINPKVKIIGVQAKNFPAMVNS
ncbi:MAG: pyridoxal-phosphate dependent enzyme [Mycoplasmoidaceae bacterium]|nr:pyridoxal-phosphate dependent enzyme [Mycoplasmoidaceae bacterium]